MTSPYGREPLCRTLPAEELEATFWYPGPGSVRQQPGRGIQAAWDIAKDHCLDCPIFLQCRDTHWGEEFGIWGGTDQYERSKYRRRLSKEVRGMTMEELHALYARLWALHRGHRGSTAKGIARATGYSYELVCNALAFHEERALARSKRRAMQRMSAAEAANWRPPGVAFPEKDPTGADGWVWWMSKPWRAHYISQTADGSWFRMKLKGGAPTAVIRWFTPGEVDLRRPVAVVHEEWTEKRKRSVA